MLYTPATFGGDSPYTHTYRADKRPIHAGDYAGVSNDEWMLINLQLKTGAQFHCLLYTWLV